MLCAPAHRATPLVQLGDPIWFIIRRPKPQFAVGQLELPFYREYLPWAAEFLIKHKDELRYDDNIVEMSQFVTRTTRATIDNYVLHAPEQLTTPLIEELLIDLLERFMLK